MGKLDINRMQNATRLNKVDDAHVEMEGDLEEIFAIPDNTDIDPSIFESVDSEGKISGVVRLYQASASSTPANCIGFQFEDGTKTKRLILVDSTLKLYEWDDPTWDEVSNLEAPGSGKIIDLTDVDVTTAQMAAGIGKLLQVNALGDAFELVAGASGSGINTFTELTDCFDITTKDPGDFVVVDGAGTGLTTAAAPTGLGNPYVHWLSAPAVGSLSQWGVHGDPEDGGSTPEPWYPAWQWYDVAADPGGFLTAATLENHADGRTNLYMTLPAGVYDISMWYETSQPNQYGVREWRARSVIVDNANGPATFGASDTAAVRMTASADPAAKAGLQFLGTRQLFLTAEDDVWIEVHQDSGAAIQACRFYLSVSRIK